MPGRIWESSNEAVREHIAAYYGVPLPIMQVAFALPEVTARHATIGDSLLGFLILVLLDRGGYGGSSDLTFAKQRYACNEHMKEFMCVEVMRLPGGAAELIFNPHRYADLVEACLHVSYQTQIAGESSLDRATKIVERMMKWIDKNIGAVMPLTKQSGHMLKTGAANAPASMIAARVTDEARQAMEKMKHQQRGEGDDDAAGEAGGYDVRRYLQQHRLLFHHGPKESVVVSNLPSSPGGIANALMHLRHLAQEETSLGQLIRAFMDQVTMATLSNLSGLEMSHGSHIGVFFFDPRDAIRGEESGEGGVREAVAVRPPAMLGNHWRQARSFEWATRTGSMSAPLFFPCCGVPAATVVMDPQTGADLRYSIFPCRRTAHHPYHRGVPIEMRKSKNSARKATEPVSWGCCQQILVKLESAPLNYSIKAEMSTGCMAAPTAEADPAVPSLGASSAARVPSSWVTVTDGGAAASRRQEEATMSVAASVTGEKRTRAQREAWESDVEPIDTSGSESDMDDADAAGILGML